MRRSRVTALLALAVTVGGCSSIGPEADIDPGATGALMVYDPTHPSAPGWRPSCGGALIHPRVLQTAGHCVQFVRDAVQAGSVEAAWVSFQGDPTAHFDADPAVEDPAAAGWYEIRSLHVNPDNADFVALRRADTTEVRAAWGKFHDSGVIVLTRAVTEATPFRLANRSPGQVPRLLAGVDCVGEGPECNLVEISYGLVEPISQAASTLVRRSSRLRYRGIDSLFLITDDDAPGSGFGSSCPGDSGAPIILANESGERGAIIAITSSPVEPFGSDCGKGGLHYRVDTASHISFVNGIIASLGDG